MKFFTNHTLRATLMLLLLVAGSNIFIRSAFGQTNIPATLSSNRFLFVLDTSASMKKKLPEMLAEVDQILGSSASGQLREGDTIGLWTFNQDVYAKFPLQHWGAIGPGDISLLIHSFMQHQRFTNSINLDKTLQEMFGVMSVSEVITVVLMYGGEEPIKGTPYDMQINRYLKANVKASKGKGVPAVVVLEAKGGRAFDYAVTASPWPVEFPPLPLPPPPEVKPVPPPVAETVKPPAPVARQLPPLILSGHPTPAPPAPPIPPTPAPVITEEKSAQPAVTANTPTAQTSEPISPAVRQPEAVPATVPQPAPTSPPVVQTVPQTVSEPTPKSAPASAPANETAPVTAQSTITGTQEPAVNSTPSKESNSAAAPAPLADAVLPVTSRPLGFLVAGLALAIVAAGLIVLMLKRTRQKEGESFISRSISGKK